MIYYVFVGYLAALLVYPFVEVFEAVHLVARKLLHYTLVLLDLPGHQLRIARPVEAIFQEFPGPI